MSDYKKYNNINLIEIIPNDLPGWAIKAMAEGQFFHTVNERIKCLEDALKQTADDLDDAASHIGALDRYVPALICEKDHPSGLKKLYKAKAIAIREVVNKC